MKLRVELKIYPQKPFAVASGHATAGILDSFLLRDRWERPYLPGTTIKGRLRYYLSQFAEEEDVIRLFGKSGNTPGALTFGDACLVDDAPWQVEVRAGVQVDRYRRVVVDKALAFAETARSEGPLVGLITGYLPPESFQRDVALLYLALKAFTHVGKSKSRGLGRVKVEAFFYAGDEKLPEETMREWVRKFVQGEN
ncbi:MAG: CRISPR-associated protein Csm3 [Eubacteriales bacterium]|nr:CRISPR-associated protein Csm3 [Eubacteriales bacterium]